MVPRSIDALATSPFREDGAQANGSSIAVLVQYQEAMTEYSVLLGADAHSSVLMPGLAQFPAPLRLDAWLPHHGSQRNVSTELLEALDCSTFLVSTNRAYFRHPAAAAIARVISYGCERGGSQLISTIGPPSPARGMTSTCRGPGPTRPCIPATMVGRSLGSASPLGAVPPLMGHGAQHLGDSAPRDELSGSGAGVRRESAPSVRRHRHCQEVVRDGATVEHVVHDRLPAAHDFAQFSCLLRTPGW